MPYLVKSVNDLYQDSDSNDGPTFEDVLARYLGMLEKDGYRLLNVLPQHEVWDPEGNPAGQVAAMLILHRDEPR
jgi:hypothetical protein